MTDRVRTIVSIMSGDMSAQGGPAARGSGSLLTPAFSQLLSFASRARVDDGFGYLSARGGIQVEQGRPTFIAARMTHVFSLGALAGWAPGHELAGHGLRALAGTHRDAIHGGWFTVPAPSGGSSRSTSEGAGPADGSKTAYVHAFVLLAAASATIAGVRGADRLLTEALSVWDERFWDDSAGMAVEEWDRTWRTCSAYRGVNANMHGVEAMLAAADALDVLAAREGRPGGASTADTLRDRAGRVVERVVHGWAREAGWRLPEHFDRDWKPLLDYNRDRPSDPFRPFGVTVGHQFEWARLCLHLVAATGDRAPGWASPDAMALYDAAVDRGWRADGLDGFVYTLDWSDRPVGTARMHWVLTEAIAAAAVLARATGDERYAADLDRWTAYGEAAFLDAAVGSWHHELTPAGQVAETTWPGKPDAYHLAQALLLPMLPVCGSVAAATAALRPGPVRST